MAPLTLPQLPGLEVLSHAPRSPYHRIPIRIGNHHSVAWLTTAIDARSKTPRPVLVVSEDDVRYLGPRVREKTELFWAQIAQKRQELGWNSVSTLKKIALECGPLGKFFDHDLFIVVHHFGVVPAAALGQCDDLIVVAAPRPAGREGNKSTSDQQSETVLLSYLEYLPDIFAWYYAQIAYLLRAVCFESRRAAAIGLCDRVRQLIAGSIRTKLADIEQCPPRYQRSKAVAEEILKTWTVDLAEARAMDLFGHLLVNYVYRALNIADRVVDYHERLQAVSGRPDHSGRDPVETLQNLARYIRDPIDDYPEEISRNEELPPWLRDLARVVRFLAEVSRAPELEQKAPLAFFLTRHFRLPDANGFALRLESGLRKRGSALLEVQQVQRNVQPTIFARIWLCDAQVLFIPTDFGRHNGSVRSLPRTEDWVIRELIYGRLLGKPLVLVRSSADSDAAFEAFVQQARTYDGAEELSRLTGASIEAIGRAQARLIDLFRDQPPTVYDDQNGLDARFWDQFRAQAEEPAAELRVESSFRAWRDWFDPKAWSVAQAVIAASRGKGGARGLRVAEVASYIHYRSKQGRFGWAADYEPSELERSVRRLLDQLVAFRFRIGQTELAPLVRSKGRNQVVYQAQIELVHRNMCKHWGLPPANHFNQKIWTILDTSPGGR